ncbi:MAG TPA: TIGR00266 family protein [Candidatus Dormibacteraeota bacterium]|nr:TIGR00266 family protein [Candidatus Dormibacteraeota bacterium]
MEPKIIGTVLPVLELNMQPGDKVFAESGQLSWMSMAIQMQTSTTAGGQSGGLFGALGRAVAGGTLFMTEYTAAGGPGLLTFAAKLPGQILPIDVAPNAGYMVHRHGFMCGTMGVQFSIGFQQRLGAGVFGGTGFRMQRLQGQGQAWVELNGEVVTYDLQAGNTLRVHPGHVGMYQETVQFNITTIPGIKNALFGGDGIFLATLTGPGRVWLQSMSMPHLAHAIAEYLPRPAESSGGLVGQLLQGS